MGQVDCSLRPAFGATATAVTLASIGWGQFYDANHPNPPPPSDGKIHIDTGLSADTHRAMGYAALGSAAIAVAVSAIEATKYGRCRSLERPLAEIYVAADCATVNARLDEIGGTSPAIRRELLDENVRFHNCAAAALPAPQQVPAQPPLTPEEQACRQRRMFAEAAAFETRDLDERRRILTHLPVCSPPAP